MESAPAERQPPAPPRTPRTSGRTSIDLRLYRLAFLPFLIAVGVLMFSLLDRPPSLTSTFPPDAFDGHRAEAVLNDLVQGYPDRSPGSNGDKQSADYVRERLVQLGFDTSLDHFTAEADGADRKLVNVAGELRGFSDRRIVVMAQRDTASPPGAANGGSGTAMMLELASALQRTRHRKTIVMVSTDGDTAGNAGARHFLKTLSQASPDEGGPVDAVVVVDDVARRHPSKPFLLAWSAGPRSGSLQLARTARTALRSEVGPGAGDEPSPVAQFFRQAVPLALQEQGVLIQAGLAAATISSGGELPARGAADRPAAVSPGVLERFGKAALGTVLAVDSRDRLEHGPSSYLVVRRKVVPGYAVRLIALALLLPLLVAAIDAVALAQRRRAQLLGWLRWAVAAALPFAAVLPAAYLFSWIGFLPDVPSEPFDPSTAPFGLRSGLALLTLAVVWALVWVLVRGSFARRAPEEHPTGVGPSAAIAALLALELLVMWLTNPFACLLLLPAGHLWMLATLPSERRRPLGLALMLLGGLVLPVTALAYYAIALDTGIGILFYSLLLVAGRSVGILDAVFLCVLAGTFVSAVAICLAKRHTPADQLDITIRGPLGYAGPGSLGGTESALGRQ